MTSVGSTRIRSSLPVVDLEVVLRHLHRLAFEQGFEVLSEQFPLERRGVVVVDRLALFEVEVREVLVVVVERDAGDAVAEVAGDEPGDGRLPAPLPRDPDHERGNGHILRSGAGGFEGSFSSPSAVRGSR